MDPHYIVDAVFVGKKQIEPSWFYATALRLLSLMPDAMAVRLLGKLR